MMTLYPPIASNAKLKHGQTIMRQGMMLLHPWQQISRRMRVFRNSPHLPVHGNQGNQGFI
jgi:hypothetical protein